MSEKNSFSRREFARRGAIAAAALAASPSVYAQNLQSISSSAETTIRLGLASYTFRNFNRARLIDFMKELKIVSLNAKDVKDHLPTDVDDEAAALADYAAAGISLHAAGTISLAKDDDADMRAKFDYCRRAGVKVMVAGDPSPQGLPRAEKLVKEYDIRVAIHNHGPEDKLWRSPLDILRTVRDMDPRIGCCIDVGHTVRAGTDVVQAIREAGPRLSNIHMKDLTKFDSKESQVAVGEGKMPVRKIFEALIAANYRGFVDLEYEVHPDDPMPGVIASFAYMRGMLEGIGYSHA